MSTALQLQFFMVQVVNYSAVMSVFWLVAVPDDSGWRRRLTGLGSTKAENWDCQANFH